MTLGERIQYYRKKMGMSQETLAERLGVSRQAVSKWELNDSAPELDKLLAMADLFGCTVDDLLGRSGPAEGGADTAAQPAPEPPRSDGWKEARRIARERGYYVGYLMMFWGGVEAVGALLMAVVWRTVTKSMMGDMSGVHHSLGGWGGQIVVGGFDHMGGMDHTVSAISSAPLLLLGFAAVVGLVVAVIGGVIVYRGKRKNKK